jgi:hypothetical protein
MLIFQRPTNEKFLKSLSDYCGSNWPGPDLQCHCRRRSSAEGRTPGANVDAIINFFHVSRLQTRDRLLVGGKWLRLRDDPEEGPLLRYTVVRSLKVSAAKDQNRLTDLAIWPRPGPRIKSVGLANRPARLAWVALR